MIVTADANVIVRILVDDDPHQSAAARKLIQRADAVALSTAALCETVWVLTQGYGLAAKEVAAALRKLVESATVSADRPSINSGLAMLEAGGDFADGVIVHEGEVLGGRVFASFDKKAIKIITKSGKPAQIPA